MDDDVLRTLGAAAIRHRRALHAIPEIGLDLPETSAYLRAALSALGLEARASGPGLVVDIGAEGPLVAIRADMDGLPVTEETGLSFASVHEGAMHACGHDAHMACLLAVAERLAAAPPEGFRARLLFQPGEEGHFGARSMIAAGCLDGVSAIAGGHVGALSDELAPGEAGFLPGTMMAACDTFQGAFIGEGGHGSAPHQARDPIPALASFVLAAQAVRSRRADQRKPFVVSVCELSAGSTHNVIPGRASFKGTVRTIDPDDRRLARAALEAAVQGCALAGGVGGEFEWIEGYPRLRNDAASTAVAMEAARRAMPPESVKALSVPVMGAEDFSYYLERVPGTFWFLCTQAPERGISRPNHNARFDVDEGLLGRFAAVNLEAARALAASVCA